MTLTVVSPVESRCPILNSDSRPFTLASLGFAWAHGLYNVGVPVSNLIFKYIDKSEP